MRSIRWLYRGETRDQIVTYIHLRPLDFDTRTYQTKIPMHALGISSLGQKFAHNKHDQKVNP